MKRAAFVAQVSGGGTGTHLVTGRLPWMTELQCGSYATMDAQYKAVGGADFENALTVLTTVVSRPHPNEAVIDAGLKAVTPEFGDPDVLVAGASWDSFSEEHGQLARGHCLQSGQWRQNRVGPAARMHDHQPLRPDARDRGRSAQGHLANRRPWSRPVAGHRTFVWRWRSACPCRACPTPAGAPRQTRSNSSSSATATPRPAAPEAAPRGAAGRARRPRPAVPLRSSTSGPVVWASV